MILNTGTRTDIPAFYSEWFYNRIAAGYVLVRNPYYPQQVLRYNLAPELIDCIAFCTKNPRPMLPRLQELAAYSQFWFVTITPYGADIEPRVPEVDTVIATFQQLSRIVGIANIGWRYDPILLTDTYNIEFHLEAFANMAKALSGYTDHCVISFLRLYTKTKLNFPEARVVSAEERQIIGRTFVEIGQRYGMQIRGCITGKDLVKVGINCDGCMSQAIMERAIGINLNVPASKHIREGCDCLLGGDIGAYNTCGHGCHYCYANYNEQTVVENQRKHNPNSPFLIGDSELNDIVKEVKQVSIVDRQLALL